LKEDWSVNLTVQNSHCCKGWRSTDRKNKIRFQVITKLFHVFTDSFPKDMFSKTPSYGVNYQIKK